MAWARTGKSRDRSNRPRHLTTDFVPKRTPDIAAHVQQVMLDRGVMMPAMIGYFLSMEYSGRHRRGTLTATLAQLLTDD
jgi:hypothetical protein